MAINIEKLYGLAYENLHTICRGYAKECNLGDGEEFFQSVLKTPDYYRRYFPALEPAIEIWDTSKNELMKSKGGTVYTAVKRIVKSIGDSRPSVKGCWIDEENRQCFCDGYRGVRLKNHIDGFETVPGVNLTPIMAIEGECVMLNLPSPGELKACIAEQKGHKDKFYDFGGNLPRVNAMYLKDVMDIFPNAVAKSYGTNKPIIFEDEIGDAILLPVHKSNAA